MTNPDEPIIILQVVDHIYPSRDGNESMVAAAFLRMGQFIHDHPGEDMELEFTYGGQHYAAIAGER